MTLTFWGHLWRYYLTRNVRFQIDHISKAIENPTKKTKVMVFSKKQGTKCVIEVSGEKVLIFNILR